MTIDEHASRLVDDVADIVDCLQASKTAASFKKLVSRIRNICHKEVHNDESHDAS